MSFTGDRDPAFPRINVIGTVPLYDVAEADQAVDVLGADIVHDRFQRGQVAVAQVILNRVRSDTELAAEFERPRDEIAEQLYGTKQALELAKADAATFIAKAKGGVTPW